MNPKSVFQSLELNPEITAGELFAKENSPNIQALRVPEERSDLILTFSPTERDLIYTPRAEHETYASLESFKTNSTPEMNELVSRAKLKEQYIINLKELYAISELKNNKQSRVASSIGSLMLSSTLSANNSKFPTVGTYVELGAIKPEDLPELAVPVVEFLDQVQPHIVIGCDRGGRLFSLALHATWGQLKTGKPFPTLDGKIHFTRISKSEDQAVLQQQVDAIVEQALRDGEMRGNTLDERERLRVVFVDDWVIGGGTMRLTKRLMAKHGAETYFAVMCGTGADATGTPDLKTSVTWHDRPEHIGVNYLSSIRLNTDGSATQQLKPERVRAPEAAANRQKIQAAARLVAAESLTKTYAA